MVNSRPSPILRHEWYPERKSNRQRFWVRFRFQQMTRHRFRGSRCQGREREGTSRWGHGPEDGGSRCRRLVRATRRVGSRQSNSLRRGRPCDLRWREGHDPASHQHPGRGLAPCSPFDAGPPRRAFFALCTFLASSLKVGRAAKGAPLGITFATSAPAGHMGLSAP